MEIRRAKLPAVGLGRRKRLRSSSPLKSPTRCPTEGTPFRGLEVDPAGGKYWRFKYRFAGKEKRISLRVYDDVSLAAAREERDACRKLLAKGIDPGVQRKALKAARASSAALSPGNGSKSTLIHCLRAIGRVCVPGSRMTSSHTWAADPSQKSNPQNSWL